MLNFKKGHGSEEYVERMTRMVIDPEIIYYWDYSRKTGHLLWGKNVLNEARLLTYISKEHLLEVVEQAICLSLNKELEPEQEIQGKCY